MSSIGTTEKIRNTSVKYVIYITFFFNERIKRAKYFLSLSEPCKEEKKCIAIEHLVLRSLKILIKIFFIIPIKINFCIYIIFIIHK